MSHSKSPTVPVWYKNTYFWIAGALLLVGIIGLPIFGGDTAIRDPGQKVEHGLWMLYLVAAVVMLIGGFLSHRQTVQQYNEEMETRS